MEEPGEQGAESGGSLDLAWQVEDPLLGMGLITAIRELPEQSQAESLEELAKYAEKHGLVTVDAARKILDHADPLGKLSSMALGEAQKLGEFKEMPEVRQAEPEPEQIFPPPGDL